VLGNQASSDWYNNCSPDKTVGYVEQNFTFAGCSTTMHSLKIADMSEVQPGKPNLIGVLASKLYHVVNEKSHTWAHEDVCNYHDEYCTGSNQQFVDHAECMRFMNALPTVSAACGVPEALSGNSSACRFKHHYMIPFAPELHCFHIGYGLPDAHGEIKCSEAECTGQNAGNPALVNTVITAADKSCLDNGPASSFLSQCTV
jgi:hypothetical protein